MLEAKGLSSTAMVLAAGMSQRMRPLTDAVPKPLIKLHGLPLIDRVLARLDKAAVACAAVNLHYHADKLEEYLRTRTSPRIVFSDEREKLLDSGGGAKRMLPRVGNKPFLLANSDTVWIESAYPNVNRIVEAWDPASMDILLLLASTATSIGFEGRGDFTCAPDGRLMRRGESEVAPFAYAGFGIFKPQLFDDTPDQPFSLNLLFDRAIERGRLYGIRLDGVWMHVGTPEALREAEAALTASVA